MKMFNPKDLVAKIMKFRFHEQGDKKHLAFERSLFDLACELSCDKIVGYPEVSRFTKTRMRIFEQRTRTLTSEEMFFNYHKTLGAVIDCNKKTNFKIRTLGIHKKYHYKLRLRHPELDLTEDLLIHYYDLEHLADILMGNFSFTAGYTSDVVTANTYRNTKQILGYNC